MKSKSRSSSFPKVLAFMRIVASAIAIVDGALAAEPEPNVIHKAYILLLSVDPGPGYWETPKSELHLRNPITIEINGIPTRICQLTGGGGQYITKWLGKGKNRIRVVGPHKDYIKLKIGEAGILETGENYVGPDIVENRVKPDEQGVGVDLDAELEWLPPEADELDMSEAGTAKTKLEIQDIFKNIEAVAKNDQGEALRKMGRELFLDGIVRGGEAQYWRFRMNSVPPDLYTSNAEKKPLLALERQSPLEKLRYVHGKRGVLVYSGFWVQPNTSLASPYLFSACQLEKGIAETPPFVFLRHGDKWQIWIGND